MINERTISKQQWKDEYIKFERKNAKTSCCFRHKFVDLRSEDACEISALKAPELGLRMQLFLWHRCALVV